MPILRRLLLLKNYPDLTAEEMTLYRSYKNRVTSLVEYAQNPVRAEWSFPVEIFHNLTPENLPVKELHALYRAIFDVTSYYQHNTAGIAKFGNAIISKLGPPENLVTELHLKKLPSKLLGDSVSKWIGTGDDDVTTDVVNRVKDSVIFMEFKFRVDSGCTAGRREVWETKFLKIIQHIITGKELFARGSRRQSLSEFLKNNGIHTIELYIGILFDIKGKFATVSEDQSFICYGGMQEGYQRTRTYLNQNNVQYEELTPTDQETEAFLLEFTLDDFTVKIGAKYANSAIDTLFKGKGKDLSSIRAMIDSLIYDDLWLSQLLAVSERAILLSHNNNYLLTIENLLKSEEKLRKDGKLFIETRENRPNDASRVLTSMTRRILKEHKTKFSGLPTPSMFLLIQAYSEKYKIEDYIADIIQVLLSIDFESILIVDQPTLEDLM